jgi:hypothetical protein
MLSLPEEWDYSEVGLSKLSKDGVGGTAKALDELETFGYLRRSQIKEDNGKFAGYEYDIFEKPQINLPYTENPFTEKPFTENQGQLNTNISNTNTPNNTISKKKLQRKIENYETEFEEIWSIYPRKEAKAVGLKHFISARKNGTSIETIKQGLDRYIEYCRVNKVEKKYIKNGGNWFKEQLWTNQYEITKGENNEVNSGYNGRMPQTQKYGRSC